MYQSVVRVSHGELVYQGVVRGSQATWYYKVWWELVKMSCRHGLLRVTQMSWYTLWDKSGNVELLYQSVARASHKELVS
jgi:hypothetical protein